MSYFLQSPIIIKLAVAVSLFLQLTLSGYVQAANLERALKQALTNHFSAQFPETDINIALNSINNQLKQRKCKNFDFSLPETLPAGGRLSVRVKCSSPQKWMTYVTGKVSILANVATTSRAISKNSRLTAKDLRFSIRNLATLNQGYFQRPEQVIGLTTRRSISAHKVLTTNMLEQPKLIYKGDKLIIEAQKGALTVRMSGTALQDGRYGEQISVINDKSRLTIHGYVHSRGVVRVIE